MFACTRRTLRDNEWLMILKVVRFVILAAVCGFSLTGRAAPRAEHVFIISIDGAAPGVIQQSRMPVLKKLVAAGACTWDAQTIKPCTTLPAHTSMLTGVGAKQHKMTWNSWIPTNGLVEVPTIFAIAKKAGLSTAMFVGKEKFRHLEQPGTLDVFNYDRANSIVILKSDSGGEDKKKEGNVFARMVATNAASYILKHKPNLCFIHFPDPDSYGHEFGWGSTEQIRALADSDAGLDIIMKAIRKAGIAKRSVILITADHGGHGKGHSKGEPVDMQIPWIASGLGVKKGFTITEPVSTRDTAATALWLLDLQPPSKLDAAVVSSAFK